MAVYIQKKYIPNNIRQEIRSHCGAQEAASFLKEKYKWKQETLDNIEWELHAAFVQKQTYSRKKTILKYIHRWLPSGSKSFGQNLGYNYCEGDGNHHDHDHFITCDFSIVRKEERIQAITNKLNVLLTPTDVSAGIINGIWSFYNNTMEKNVNHAKNKEISDQQRI